MASWLVAATLILGLLLALLANEEPERVSVPPVHETKLRDAAREAGCVLARAEAGERLNPPVVGGAGAVPARPGFYREPVRAAALIAALREGVVVIQFRGLDRSDLKLLRNLQEAVPDGTIVVPNATGMPFAVAASAYRRLLGCRKLDDTSAAAIQLFRGRFVGSSTDP